MSPKFWIKLKTNKNYRKDSMLVCNIKPVRAVTVY